MGAFLLDETSFTRAYLVLLIKQHIVFSPKKHIGHTINYEQIWPNLIFIKAILISCNKNTHNFHLSHIITQ